MITPRALRPTVVILGLVFVGVGCSMEDTKTLGILSYNTGSPTALIAELEDRGWVEGENLTIVWDRDAWAEDIDAEAARLVELEVDVLYAHGAPSTFAAIAAAEDADVPIVSMATANNLPSIDIDGVTGLVGSPAPGRAVELASLAVPIERVLLPVIDSPGALTAAANAEVELAAIGVEVVRVDYGEAAELPDVIRAATGVDAIIPAASGANRPYFAAAAEAALEVGLPHLTVSEQTVYGAFLSYGFVDDQLGAQMADWVIPIFEGNDVDSIPFGEYGLHLTLNTDTAEALGIELPQSLLDQALRTNP